MSQCRALLSGECEFAVVRAQQPLTAAAAGEPAQLGEVSQCKPLLRGECEFAAVDAEQQLGP